MNLNVRACACAGLRRLRRQAVEQHARRDVAEHELVLVGVEVLTAHLHELDEEIDKRRHHVVPHQHVDRESIVCVFTQTLELLSDVHFCSISIS